MPRLTSRSRALEFQRCPRLRYWAHEWKGTGLEPVRTRIPLAIGGATHLGLADLLRGRQVEYAIDAAMLIFDFQCQNRQLDLQVPADSSRIYQEQRALVEALVRMAALRTVPALLQTYEVLEVEKLDVVELAPGILWRSIPDALLRKRDSGELYLLSWKTCAEYDRQKAAEARVDFQGLSEAWAWEEREKEEHAQYPIRNTDTDIRYYPPTIRGIQMLYLVKGKKIPLAGTGSSWRTNSPLVYGYRNQDFPPKLAFSRTWNCSSPHPMRKSKWYPTGECPGDGRNHLRGDDWTSFAVWEAMGVKEWIGMLDAGQVTPEAGDPLESNWAIPVPVFREKRDSESWLLQTTAQEMEVTANLDVSEVQTETLSREYLDLKFPQYRESCEWMFGSKCPCWEICWGPDEVAEDPIGSGLFRIRTPYQEQRTEEMEMEGVI